MEIVRFHEHHGPVRPNGTHRAAMRDPQMGSSSSPYRLIGEDHVHTTVAEAVDAALEMLTHSPDDA